MLSINSMRKGIYLLGGLLAVIAVVAIVGLIKKVNAADKQIVSIQNWETQNGVPVFFVESTQIPIVDIAVLFDAGSRRDGNQQGLAYLTNSILSKGAKDLDANTIADRFDDVGALFNESVDLDKAMLSLRSLVEDKYLDSALQVFTDVVTAPSFPKTDFERLKEQTLVGLQQEDQEPSSIADRSFFKLLYDGDPYGHPVNGNPKSIKQMELAALKAFYQKYYVAENAMIIIVGDISRDRANEIAKQLSDAIPQGSQAENLALAQSSGKKLVTHINFPSEQTHVVMGQVAIERKNPDYFPLLLGNHILGGSSMNSRLFGEVREKRGLVYSVASSFYPLKDRGPFSIELQTRASETENVLNLVQSVFTKFIEEGPTQEELELAKKNLIGAFPLYFSSNAGIFANVSNIAYYQLPLDYLDTYRDKLAAVTVTDIQQAFLRHLKLDHFAIVTVGRNVSPKS